MNKTDISNEVAKLTREVVKNSKLSLTNDTVFEEIENWDSFNMVDLEVDIESSFNIAFDPGEFLMYKNIKDVVDAIVNKLT